MGKYRATLNMAGAKRGKIGEFPDADKRTLRLVSEGHLIPVDVSAEALKRIEEMRAKPEVHTGDTVSAVKAALIQKRKEAAERAAAKVEEAEAPEESPVSTSVTTSVTTAVAPEPDPEPDPEPERPSYSGSRSSKSPAKKSSGSRSKSSGSSSRSRSRKSSTDE
jgi:hypothetical protein